MKLYVTWQLNLASEEREEDETLTGWDKNVSMCDVKVTDRSHVVIWEKDY